MQIKRDPDGNVTKYKARLCACGYSQEKGIDYHGVFSPVVKPESLRTLLTVAAKRQMIVHQMDVVSAFLNGTRQEEIFMKQPPGFIKEPSLVCRLKKNLYGLKQAPRTWHLTIEPVLKSLGFKPATADPCLYIRHVSNSLSLIGLHVDDLAIACDNPEDLNDIKKQLTKSFQMTDNGELQNLLGIKVRRDLTKKAFFLSSELKTKEIINDFLDPQHVNTQSSSPISSLDISCADSPYPDSEEWIAMQQIPYRQCVGQLINLCRTTRPDISFATTCVSRYMHNPGRPHWNAVQKILAYLKNTPNLELKLDGNDPLILMGYSDSDWAGDKDTSKSTTGYVFSLGSSPISWTSKTQKTVATSSTYAEYIAQYHTATEAIWLRQLLKDLHILQDDAPTSLQTDNLSSISICNLTAVTPRNKHFDTKFHYIRELINNKSITIQHCSGSSNPADPFTKPQSKTGMRTMRERLGLHNCVNS